MHGGQEHIALVSGRWSAVSISSQPCCPSSSPSQAACVPFGGAAAGQSPGRPPPARSGSQAGTKPSLKSQAASQGLRQDAELCLCCPNQGLGQHNLGM